MFLHWSFAKKSKNQMFSWSLLIWVHMCDSTLISVLTASDQWARIMFDMFTAVPQNSLSLVLPKRFFIQFQSSWSRALHLIRVQYSLGIKWNLFSVDEEGHVGCSWKQNNSSFFVSKFLMCWLSAPICVLWIKICLFLVSLRLRIWIPLPNPYSKTAEWKHSSSVLPTIHYSGWFIAIWHENSQTTDENWVTTMLSPRTFAVHPLFEICPSAVSVLWLATLS